MFKFHKYSHIHTYVRTYIFVGTYLYAVTKILNYCKLIGVMITYSAVYKNSNKVKMYTKAEVNFVRYRCSQFICLQRFYFIKIALV